MKVLIPTAKELNKDCITSQGVRLSVKTKKIVKEMASFDVLSLTKVYKVNDNIAQIEYDNWQSLKSNKAKVYPAFYYFNGLMYRNIKRHDLSKDELSYIEENVYITSSLYGVIPALYPIASHRLDFMTKVKINDNSLKKFWQGDYDKSVKGEQVVSLLSSEFEEVFSKKIRDNFIKVVFMEERDGSLKTHSTISKKARGKFLTELIENNIKNIDELKNISFDNFSYDKQLSEDKKLVFVAR